MSVIATVEDASAALAALNEIMDRLGETLTVETDLLRKGRVREATALETTKAQLASAYAVAAGEIRTAGPLIARTLPTTLEPLRKRHADMQKLLQANMTVLATAHAVSEGIIRGVSGELEKRQAPSTYGASGRANAPKPRAGQPLALSRAI